MTYKHDFTLILTLLYYTYMSNMDIENLCFFINIIVCYNNCVMSCDGTERFIFNGQDIGINVLDFWKFSYSDLNSDPRDYLAEYLVSHALGIDKPYNKEGWTLFDILYKGKRIEVKCTGYFQTWRTDGATSNIRSFSISPAHDKENNTYERQNDVYVFCLLLGTTRETANPLNLDNWEFYIVPTSLINEQCGKNKRINLNRIKKLGIKTSKYTNIKPEIDAIIKSFS